MLPIEIVDALKQRTLKTPPPLSIQSSYVSTLSGKSTNLVSEPESEM